MKHLRTLFVGLFAVLLVVGCGGGGGGSDGDDQPAVTYTGLLTQARITAENAMEFNAFILGDGIFPLPPMEELVAVPETQALVTSRESRPATSSTATALTCTPTTETGSFPGAISGHVDYSARISEDCSAVIEFSYVNFNDGDGSIYDGVLTVRVFDYDMSSEMFMSMALSTDALEFQGDAVHIVLSGTATLSLAGSDALTSVETMTMNFDGRDEVTRKTFRVQDLRSALSCNTSTFPPNYCSEQVSGRIYLEDDGYVEISVDTPLVYNYASRFNVDVPDAGGPVILHGAGNTREVITPLSIVQVNIGLDTNGDGSFEESTTLDWRDLVALVFTFEALQGTVNFDVANDGTETADGGFAAVGWTNAMGEDQLDGYLVKVNAAGELEWAAQYGGAGDQSLQSVVQAR
ncbi:MAG TPA: hypothetical protein VLT88_00090, partial [Desulfosarcina sp.]|nr:hypothetical protein [Desulfosarcina sp.]